MCGLAGIVDYARQPEVDVVEAMSEALRHRGPDDDGLWNGPDVALGHRRLSIIDLTPGGHQPMADETGRYQLVYNGEIYNYRELRAELCARGHSFSSDSDTEVLLRAFIEWDAECVRRLNGMWAFAVWDTRECRLFCSRDRFGIKPFYYRRSGTRLVFASELKAFRHESEPRANLGVVRDFLEHGLLDHSDETFFQGIVSLPPAHSLNFDRRGLRVERYWKIAPADEPRGDAVDAVRELFIDSIRLHLRSDVPVGTCLSGGLDSSAVACTVDHLLRTEAENARPVGARQKTFTAYFDSPGLDERPYAEAVVAATGAEPHWVTFTAADLVADLPAIVAAQEEPFGSTSIVAQWYVLREAARSGMKVLLDGQGGDELFAGYRDYLGSRLADLLLQRRFGELVSEVSAYRSVQGAGKGAVLATLGRPFLPSQVLRKVRAYRSGAAALVHRDLRDESPGLNGNGNFFPDRLRRHLSGSIAGPGLPELLRYEDRNSMAHSVEARVPFLDHRLVELAFSLDGRHLIENGRTKVILRKALEDLLPGVVRDRVDKLGFVTPGGLWMRGALGQLAADVFASRSFANRGLVDPDAARKRLEQHRRSEISAGFELWRALNVELWAQEFLDA